MPDKQNLEEQLISQAAEMTLSNQLDNVEQIDINVRTNLLKIVQGQVDEVSLAGQGLVIQEHIRVQEIKLQTDSVAINPLSVLIGQLKLNQPVNAVARIVLTEADINNALSSDLITSYLEDIKLNVESKTVSFVPQDMQVFLPGDGKLEFHGKVLLTEAENIRLLSFIAVTQPQMQIKTLIFESFQFTQGGGISVEIIIALMQKIKELLNMPYFTWEDMELQLNDMEVEKDNLILLIQAHVRQIPSAYTGLSSENDQRK